MRARSGNTRADQLPCDRRVHPGVDLPRPRPRRSPIDNGMHVRASVGAYPGASPIGTDPLRPRGARTLKGRNTIGSRSSGLAAGRHSEPASLSIDTDQGGWSALLLSSEVGGSRFARLAFLVSGEAREGADPRPSHHGIARSIGPDANDSRSSIIRKIRGSSRHDSGRYLPTHYAALPCAARRGVRTMHVREPYSRWSRWARALFRGPATNSLFDAGGVLPGAHIIQRAA